MVQAYAYFFQHINLILSFFAAQLDSIDEQTFPVTLLVRNDCPESASLEGFIQEHIKKNAYRYYHGDKNLGYVKSFEALLSLAEGELRSILRSR